MKMSKNKNKVLEEDFRMLDPIIGPFINKPTNTIIGPDPISPASLLDDDEELKEDNNDRLP
jgi:hypothetical protein